MIKLKISKLIRHFIAVVIVISITALSSACSNKKNTKPYEQYLGVESYDSHNVAMVMDYIEGEEEPGIIYREISDMDGVLHQKDMPVCVFFYSSNTTDRYGVFAGVEEIAQRLDGRVLMLGIDIMVHRELVDEYELLAVPDFVLIENGIVKDTFGASNYEYWTMTDVYNWLVLNKI